MTDESTVQERYAQLPTVDRLASADKKEPLTIVGYGANGFVKGGKPAPDFKLVRSVGDSRISKLDKTGFNLRMQAGLDTLPYNAHTTASDALWAGLPVLTCAGNAFAYRLDTAASLDFLAPYL